MTDLHPRGKASQSPVERAPLEDITEISVYDVFGSNASGINIRAGFVALERALGFEFFTRMSGFSNGAYLINRETRHGEVRCLNNVADDPCDVPYREYEGYRIVISVDYASDPDVTAALIVGEGFEHLRRRRRDHRWPTGVNGKATPSENLPLPNLNGLGFS
jgi:hypothetical protein